MPLRTRNTGSSKPPASLLRPPLPDGTKDFPSTPGEEEDSPSMAREHIRQAAHIFLQTEAVKWFPGGRNDQGQKVLPVYCDPRRLMSYPTERKVMVEMLITQVEEDIGRDNVEAIAGIATAGVPWAAGLADRLDLPLVYVRSAPELHKDGEWRQVEGVLPPQARVLLVDDGIGTGETVSQRWEPLREVGAGGCSGVLVLFAYDPDRARPRLAQAGMDLWFLCDLSGLLEVAAEKGVLPSFLREGTPGDRDGDRSEGTIGPLPGFPTPTVSATG